MGSGRDDAIYKVRLDKMTDFRLERFLGSPGAGRQIDDVMSWVLWILSASEILRRKKFEVVADRKSFRLCMKVVDSGGGVAASGEPEGAVLDEL